MIELTTNTITFHAKIKMVNFNVSTQNHRLRTGSMKKYNEVYILTYSLPDKNRDSIYKGYIEKMFDNMYNKKVTVIANSKFKKYVVKYAKLYPFNFYIHDKIHIKLTAFDDGKIIWGSSNFGNSDWLEFTTEIKSQDIYKLLVKKFIKPLIADSIKIESRRKLKLGDFI